jgi:hypothetical protein
MLNKNEALRLARSFLLENIQLKVHTESSSPIAVYNPNPKNEIFISFSIFDEPRVGSSKILSVSRVDGTVLYIGQQGE